MPEPLPPLTPDLASQIARQDPVLSQNTEAGFANTYTPGSNIPEGRAGFLIPAAGMSALGLYLLYRKHQQDKLDEEKTAAIDWQAVRAQLPGAHVPDLLLGGAAGAGAGMLYDYLRGSEKGKRFSTALRRILTGAAIGAGATNLAGDRFRRYLTNSVVPAGYDGGNIFSQLKPRSWQHVYDAAIKDKPSYDSEALKKFYSKFTNSEIAARVLAARRELHRISFGVDLHRPLKSIWQKNKSKSNAPYYSLNEKNPNYVRNVAALMLPQELSPHSLFPPDDPQYLKMMAEKGVNPTDAQKIWEQTARFTPPRGDIMPYEISNLFFAPQAALKLEYGNRPGRKAFKAQKYTDLFGTNSLLGVQHIVTRKNGPNVEGITLDRHDVTPSARDIDTATNAILTGKFLQPAWRKQTAGEGYNLNQTNAQVLKSTLGRVLWDRVLSKENPWVAQKFQFTPLPPDQRSSSDIPEYGLQFQRNDGSPAFGPLSRQQLSNYLEQAQTGTLVPPK